MIVEGAGLFVLENKAAWLTPFYFDPTTLLVRVYA